jgi:hypothetical protein
VLTTRSLSHLEGMTYPLTHPYSRVQATSWPLKLAWRPTRSITRNVRLLMRMAIPDDCSMVVSKGEAMICWPPSNRTTLPTRPSNDYRNQCGGGLTY